MKLLAVVLCALMAAGAGCGDNLAASPDATGDGDGTADGDGNSDGDVPILDAAIDASPLVDGAIGLACSIEDLTPLLTCAVTECADDATLTCVLTSCALLLFALPPDCQQCILTGLTSGDLATSLAACVSGLPTPP